MCVVKVQRMRERPIDERRTSRGKPIAESENGRLRRPAPLERDATGHATRIECTGRQTEPDGIEHALADAPANSLRQGVGIDAARKSSQLDERRLRQMITARGRTGTAGAPTI